MGFETPGESFPGSAFYYLADDPYEPLPAEARIRSDAAEPATRFSNSAVVAPGQTARPFLARGGWTDLARAQQCLTMAIYYEAASESDAGQRAVAQVVLNRVAHPSYPNTVCGVVFQGSERTTGCQFTFTCDGSLARRPAPMWWDRASRVARAALAGAVYAPVGMATHYHTVQVHPYWAPSLHHVTTIGAHRFYRWPGAAGQQAAFRAAYLGGEPAAVPHPRAHSRAVPAVLAGSDPASIPIEAAIPTPPADVQGPGTAAPTSDKPPASGSVLPAYQRSGQWLDAALR
ncbi:cell wall hydrolase [Altererythrobacter soli]|uniref:Cell wall hydrolase n=2 Tax=Croceibacterium soli TaxID=1739690 RepID=A0A6I4UQD1_9SPHN|nr:cell wall hydrolase [Croceibacterium soli]